MAGAFVFNDFNRFMDLQIMAIQGKEIAVNPCLIYFSWNLFIISAIY